MTDFKAWLQSKTLWSVLVMLAPLISRMAGFDVDATLTDILTVVGAVGAIYGRVTATKKLSLKTKKSLLKIKK
jgi:hypothetical protein